MRVGNAPSYAAAAAFEKRACTTTPCPANAFAARAARETAIFGVKLGKDRVFDVRFGDWFNLDRGTLVAWIATHNGSAPPEPTIPLASCHLA